MKYTQAQLQHRAQQALSARERGSARWDMLILALMLRFRGMRPAQAEERIEALARGEKVE